MSKNDRTLFAELSLQINSGDYIHLTGRNGAGKTSLMRVLAGLSAYDSGAIDYQPYQDERCYLYLGHKLALEPQLSAIENLQYWLNLYQRSIPVNDLYDVLATFNLVGLEDLPCGQLSAGQQRRVSLARLKLIDKPVWLLDEPMTSLDDSGQAFVQALIDEKVRHGGAVLMTSHQVPNTTVKMVTQHLEYRW